MLEHSSMSSACAHLHVHSEYSLLDGACKIEELAARAAVVRPAGAGADRPRRDERRRRAVHGLPQARHQADPGLRGVRRRRPRAAGSRQARPLPPDAARGDADRLPQPRQALLGRVPRGLPARQAVGRPRADRRSRRGRDRAHRLPAEPLLPAPARRPPRRGQGPRRASCSSVRRRERLLRGPEERARRAGAGQRGDRPDRAGARAPARRHRRRPLPRREDYHHHAALLCVQTKSTLAEPKITLRHQRVLPALERGDGAGVRGVAGGARVDARDRRALRRRARARPAADPALPDARWPERGRVPARAGRTRGSGERYGDPAPGAGGRARRVRARRDRADGLQRLLPDRLGLRQVRQGLGNRGRPGARLGGGLARRLLPADHRRRPAPLRPAVRALPEPRARVDAGHRHRLLGARARARDPLRDREVRQGVGRPDRHVRQDVPARGDARRGAGARPRLRRSATGSRS